MPLSARAAAPAYRRAEALEVRFRAAAGVGEEAHSRQPHWCPWSKPMNVETCGHVADLIVMAHAFAELRDGVVARQHENVGQVKRVRKRAGDTCSRCKKGEQTFMCRHGRQRAACSVHAACSPRQPGSCRLTQTLASRAAVVVGLAELALHRACAWLTSAARFVSACVGATEGRPGRVKSGHLEVITNLAAQGRVLGGDYHN
eukprot:scaffold47818_cov69-Phaeocystis_antarctica.AAC.1